MSAAIAPAPAEGGGAGAGERSEPLGNVGLTCPTPAQHVAEAPDNADIRWAVHRVAAWRYSPLAKVRGCRRWAHGDTEDLPIMMKRRDDGGVDVGVGGLQTCASWHSCGPCGQKIAVERARELEHIFQVWQRMGGQVVLATFTCRHDRGKRLAQLVEAQRHAWAAVRSDRPWREDLAELGVAELDQLTVEERAQLDAELLATTDRAERKVLKRRLRRTRGVIRAFECTYGDEHGHHPHFHVFLLIEPGQDMTTERARAALAPTWDRWCAGLAERGLTAVASVRNVESGEWESAGFDVQVLGEGDDDAAKEMARYPFKLALEAVGGVFKRGRDTDKDGNPLGKRHRTPFEVMEHVALADALGKNDDQARTDRAIIAEWSQTANDMRFQQCPLPPGMRAWFAAKALELDMPGPLLEKERSEEEIAAALQEGTKRGGHIPKGSYLGGGRRVDGATDQGGEVREQTAGVAYELDTLRAAGRSGGVTGVDAWFAVRGIDFRLSRTGEDWIAQEREHPPDRVLTLGERVRRKLERSRA